MSEDFDAQMEEFEGQPRIAGQDKGKIFIAPDFNDPLPDDILADFLG